MASSPPPTRAFLWQVLEGSPEPMLVTDEAGIIRYANRAAERFYLSSPSGLVNLLVVRFLPDWFALPASCRDFSTKAVLMDGSEQAITLSLAPVQTQKFIAAVAVFRNCSLKSEDNQRVLAKESRLQAQVQERDTNLAQMHSQLGEAARILEHHLPSHRIDGVEASWVFEPCQTLGGDMILLHRHEDKLILGILDVSGHGVAASLLAIGLSRALSPERGRGGCILGRKGTLRQPKDIVTRLNQDSHTLFESGLFVTLLFGILDLATGEFCFTSAGHPLPVRVGPSRAAEVSGAIDPPLGVERYLLYRQTKLILKPGQLLVLYTDGVTECRSPEGDLFGEERLLSLITETARNPGALASGVSLALHNFRGGNPASDDLSFLAIRMPK